MTSTTADTRAEVELGIDFPWRLYESEAHDRHDDDSGRGGIEEAAKRDERRV